MTKSQLARLTTLRRIQAFLDTNASALGTVSQSTSRKDLDQAVAGLAQYAAQQEGAEAEATSRTKMKDAAREALRLQHMQPIAAIAQKKLTDTPAMQDFAFPHTNTGDEVLIAMGSAMANAALQYPQVFIDQQLPNTFVDDLRAAVQALVEAVAAQSNARSKVNVATKGVKALLLTTRTEVKVMNGLVVKQLHDQPALLGAWVNAKRVHAKPGVPTGTVRTPAAPAPAGSSTPTGEEAPTAPTA